MQKMIVVKNLAGNELWIATSHVSSICFRETEATVWIDGGDCWEMSKEDGEKILVAMRSP